MYLVGTWGRWGFAEGIVPLHDVDRAGAPGIGNENGRALGQRGSRPGQELLGAAANPHSDFAGACLPAGGNDEYADPADRGFVARHNLPPLKCERQIDSLATAGGKATFR
jgi:hypothetical protein